VCISASAGSGQRGQRREREALGAAAAELGFEAEVFGCAQQVIAA
jgi:hypothetical protein